MPHANIWIRNEDWEKWQSIDNRPGWLHEHLNLLVDSVGTVYTEDENGKTVKKFPKIPLFDEKKKLATLCEHYQTKGKCLAKGCKYA